MLRYKINVSDALSRAGVNKYKAKKTKVIGQDTLTKLAEENVTGITLKTLNTVCAILELQPKDILEYVETPEDEEERNKIKSWKHIDITNKSAIIVLSDEASKSD